MVLLKNLRLYQIKELIDTTQYLYDLLDVDAISSAYLDFEVSETLTYMTEKVSVVLSELSKIRTEIHNVCYMYESE